MSRAVLKVGPGVQLLPAGVDHAAALASLIAANLPHLTAYLPVLAGLATPHAAREHLEYVAGGVAQGDLLEWHLFADDVLCGAVRLNHIDAGNRKASIGYYISASHQGRGLATSAATAVLRHCFDDLAFNRIELRCASGNVASQRVAERLGFTREGTAKQDEFLNGAFVDHHVYAMLGEEFSSL